jgi:hypothetical protein
MSWRSSGEELHDVVSEFSDIVFGLQSGKQKFPDFGLTQNWVKRSIFWELSYWKTNLLRYNLDVMHIEKNVFENIFNTVMDVARPPRGVRWRFSFILLDLGFLRVTS